MLSGKRLALPRFGRGIFLEMIGTLQHMICNTLVGDTLWFLLLFSCVFDFFFFFFGGGGLGCKVRRLVLVMRGFGGWGGRLNVSLYLVRGFQGYACSSISYVIGVMS